MRCTGNCALVPTTGTVTLGAGEKTVFMVALKDASSRLGDQLEVFHHRGGGKKWPNDGTPLSKRRGTPEPHGVVFQRGPENLQNIALRVFNAVVHLETLKSFCMGNDGFQATLDGLFKGDVLAGLDRKVGEFKNHKNLRWGWFNLPTCESSVFNPAESARYRKPTLNPVMRTCTRHGLGRT